jgi:predicted Fe-S protein YdhL (DUF1289 family)
MNPGDPRCHKGPPLSPCIKVCRVDRDANLCVGCWRTVDEIAAWYRLRDDEKRAVLADLARRRPPAAAPRA